MIIYIYIHITYIYIYIYYGILMIPDVSWCILMILDVSWCILYDSEHDVYVANAAGAQVADLRFSRAYWWRASVRRRPQVLFHYKDNMWDISGSSRQRELPDKLWFRCVEFNMTLYKELVEAETCKTQTWHGYLELVLKAISTVRTQSVNQLPRNYNVQIQL